MPYYRSVGEVPHKRHTQFRRPDGGLYAEELMGQEGFSSDSSLLYHRHPPTAISAAEVYEPPATVVQPNLPLLPRHLRTHNLDAGPADAVLGRRPLLVNADVRIGYVVADRPSPLYRDAVGDECLYVEAGNATIETTFGALTVTTGDYVVIPTSVVHRVVPQNGPVRLLTIEATGHVGPPKRYLSARGQFLEHSPYCERDVRGPDQPMQVDGTDVEVYVKHRAVPLPKPGLSVGGAPLPKPGLSVGGAPLPKPGLSVGGAGWTRYVYAQHPFDVVGWDGCLYPWAFSIHDFEPITGRVHQPPPVHQTFEGPNFVVCSFVPRKVDYHPLAIAVPYNHHNVDSDEMMFYTGGNYEARRGSGIEQGSISLHPSGFTHGPQPGAVERAIGAEFFDELAVMVDTFRPLELCEAALSVEDSGYAWTWNR